MQVSVRCVGKPRIVISLIICVWEIRVRSAAGLQKIIKVLGTNSSSYNLGNTHHYDNETKYARLLSYYRR